MYWMQEFNKARKEKRAPREAAITHWNWPYDINETRFTTNLMGTFLETGYLEYYNIGTTGFDYGGLGSGGTALHVAIALEDYAGAELLLRHGADGTVRGGKGRWSEVTGKIAFEVAQQHKWSNGNMKQKFLNLLAYKHPAYYCLLMLHNRGDGNFFALLPEEIVLRIHKFVWGVASQTKQPPEASSENEISERLKVAKVKSVKEAKVRSISE